VIGNTVFQAQFAEPSIGQVDLNFSAKLALRSDGEHISDDQHPDHQDRIDRRPADLGIVRLKRAMNPRDRSKTAPIFRTR
jgi:hypothetical protein